MNDRNFTYEILKEECVGDSLAKHNFNFLSLDSIACNLSSLFFKSTDENSSLWDSFYDFSLNKKNFNDNLPLMLNPFTFDRTYAGVSSLSSYWLKQELTVEYEYNKSNVNNVKSFDYFLNNTSTFLTELTSRGLDYLNLNYPVENFNLNGIINLVIPVYANDGTIKTKYNYNVYDSKTKAIIPQESNTLPIYEKIPSSLPNQEFREISCYYTKNDSNFGTINILKYKNIKNNWTFSSFLSSVCDDFKSLSVVSTNVTIDTSKNQLNNSIQTYTAGPCSPLAFNYWYNRDLYVNAIANITGIKKYKNSSLKLSFKNIDGQIVDYYSTIPTPESPTVYLKFDDFNQITASNNTGNLNIKQMPFVNIKGVQFMFSYNTPNPGKANPSVCGSSKVFKN